jgi:hypothetical protein
MPMGVIFRSVFTGEGGFLDFERIHQGDDIEGDRRRLTVAHGRARQEARRAIAPQRGNDDAIALRRELRRHVDKAVDVVGPAVQEQHWWTIGGAGLGVAALSKPASICFSVPNKVCDSGLTKDNVALPDCASTARIMPSWAAATVKAAARTK